MGEYIDSDKQGERVERKAVQTVSGEAAVFVLDVEKLVSCADDIEVFAVWRRQLSVGDRDILHAVPSDER